MANSARMDASDTTRQHSTLYVTRLVGDGGQHGPGTYRSQIKLMTVGLVFVGFGVDHFAGFGVYDDLAVLAVGFVNFAVQTMCPGWMSISASSREWPLACRPAVFNASDKGGLGRQRFRRGVVALALVLFMDNLATASADVEFGIGFLAGYDLDVPDQLVPVPAGFQVRRAAIVYRASAVTSACLAFVNRDSDGCVAVGEDAPGDRVAEGELDALEL